MKNRSFVFLALAAILINSCAGPTPAPVVNPTEAASPTPTLQPAGSMPTALSTATAPLAAPNNVPLNCRSGPGIAWPVVVVLNPGQSTEIVGRSTDSGWLYVKNLNLAGSFCWIAAGFTTVTGDASTLAIVPAPALPAAASAPAAAGATATHGVVTWVDVSVAPDTIHIDGCNGLVPLLTVSAYITTNGPVDIRWHVKDGQAGNRKVQDLSFKQADTLQVVDSYSPRRNAGNFSVQIEIDGMNLESMNAKTLYTINC